MPVVQKGKKMNFRLIGIIKIFLHSNIELLEKLLHMLAKHKFSVLK